MDHRVSDHRVLGVIATIRFRHFKDAPEHCHIEDDNHWAAIDRENVSENVRVREAHALGLHYL